MTGLEKLDYWRSLFRRYANAVATGQHFLVAELDTRVVGFVIGEVRDWEFGSPPCGWVFGIDASASPLGGISDTLAASHLRRVSPEGRAQGAKPCWLATTP